MQRFFAAAILLLLACLGQAQAAATLLPPGEQCFAANSPTSGGTLGPITVFGAISGGASYVNGTYTNVPLTGGSGFGAQATITVTLGSVSSVALTNPGSHYAAGDTLSATTASIGGGSGAGFSVPVNSVSTTGTGFIGLLGTITAGTGGTSGTYANVTLTGGQGSGATANITVSGGGVTAVSILNPGSGYVVGDTLTAASGSIGNVSGFTVPVASVAINNSLAGGSVTFYIPGTTTLKSTWFNADQAANHLNPNPVPLDANGCAVIYGTGSYRQILKDSVGNTIWDQTTTDTSAGASTFWAGTAGGTPNAITIVDAGFNGTDGSIVGFTAIASNTGPVTLNPSGFGNIAVLKDTTAGPVALTGAPSEITQSNPVWVSFRASDNSFHLINTVIASASGATAPLCGAVGLKITNSVGTPNTILTITASQALMQTNAGLVINRSNVSQNINITLGTSTATAGGMDGESTGTNQWLYIWLIDNGAAPAGLASTSSTAPTMPSGYTYKCRLGAMAVDGSSNLFRTIQTGALAQYQLVASSNTTLPCVIFHGSAGTFSFTSPTLAAEQVTGNGFCAPPTATAGWFLVTDTYQGNAACNVMAAPSTSWGGTNNGPNGTNGLIWPLFVNASDNNVRNQQAIMNLESNSIGYAGGGAGCAVELQGWKDAVNAN